MNNYGIRAPAFSRSVGLADNTCINALPSGLNKTKNTVKLCSSHPFKMGKNYFPLQSGLYFDFEQLNAAQA